MAKEKIFLNKREWLNPKGHADTGAIASKVSADKYGVYGHISIWDCGRKIELSIYYDNEKEAKQRARKLQMLIDHMKEVQVALGQAYPYYLEHKEEEDDDQDL